MADRSTSSSAHTDDPYADKQSRSRLWLAAWLTQRPDVLARLTVALRRLREASAGTRKTLARAAGGTLGAAALLLALASLRAPVVQAATINVDSSIVAIANDGKCSLPEAMFNANNDNRMFNAYGECAAGVGPDTINLPGGMFTLQSAYGGSAFYGDNGLPPVTGAITINGNGATIERDANAPKFRILSVAGSGDLKLNDTTISNGDTAVTGGGLYVYINGKATVTGSTIFGNSAYRGGGIHGKLATVAVVSSTISGNTATSSQGGGIAHNLGTLTILDSTISGNTAATYGGGIANLHGGVVTITGSTIRGNTANSSGGVYNIGGTVNFVNSTITDNTASNSGGGVHNFGGTVSFESSTVTGNSANQFGGGLLVIHALAATEIRRSVFSGNSALHGDEVYRTIGADPVIVDDYNVFGHAGADSASAFGNFTPGSSDFNAAGDAGNVPLAGILASLDNNGGPTFTHNLVPGSPAIDFAPSAACAGELDQRGYGRPADGNGQASANECDSGAVEYNAALPTPTMTPTTTPTPSPTATTTPSPTSSATPTATGSPTPSATPTVGPSPTQGPSPTATSTATAGPSPTASPTGTQPAMPDFQLFMPLVVRPAQ